MIIQLDIPNFLIQKLNTDAEIFAQTYPVPIAPGKERDALANEALRIGLSKIAAEQEERWELSAERRAQAEDQEDQRLAAEAAAERRANRQRAAKAADRKEIESYSKISYADFLAMVKETLLDPRVKRGVKMKAFIHSTLANLPPPYNRIPLENFKKWLLIASKRGDIVLASAGRAGLQTPKDLAASETVLYTDGRPEVTYHYIVADAEPRWRMNPKAYSSTRIPAWARNEPQDYTDSFAGSDPLQMLVAQDEISNSWDDIE